MVNHKITLTELAVHLLGEEPVSCHETPGGSLVVKDRQYHVHEFSKKQVAQARKELCVKAQPASPGSPTKGKTGVKGEVRSEAGKT